MKRKSVIAVAWVVGILFAPNNLVVLGNSAGSLGIEFVFLLFLTLLAYIFHSRSYQNIAEFRSGALGEFERIAVALGSMVAVISSIAPRVLLTVFLATSTLVASGYVFNEVFMHRFPNFAFAYLMLGALLAVNLISRSLSEKIQVILSGTAVAGILGLSFVGILNWLKTCEIVYTETLIPPLKGSFSLILLFIGFDLLLFTRNKYSDHGSSLRRYLVTGLIVAGIVFCFWGFASFLHVPESRLSKTTIPHILAAKNILGETGRIVMGLVIICGTGAAVNTLFAAVSGMIAEVSRQAILPASIQRLFNHPSTTIVLLALVIGAMMALGVAGTDALDTYLRGSLILWLLNYAVIHAAFILQETRRMWKSSNHLLMRKYVPRGAFLVVILIGSLVLIVTDDNPGLLVRYLVAIFISVGISTWLGRRVLPRYRKGYIMQSK